MKKERTGSPERVAIRVAGFVTTILLIVFTASSAGAVAAQIEKPAEQKKGKSAKAKPGLAIISGTVFRDPGLSFPGVEVTLQPNPEGKTSNKPGKKMKTVSDSRGEFSFRIAALPMRYNVSAQASGYQTEKSVVVINGEERQDVFFTLKPAQIPAGNPARE